MKTILLSIFLVVLAPYSIMAEVAVYGNLLGTLSRAIPIPTEPQLKFLGILAPGYIAATLTSAIFCYPIAFLYKKYSIVLAVAMTIPVFYLRQQELLDPHRSTTAFIVSTFELASYLSLVVFGTLIARHHLIKKTDKKVRHKT